MPGASVLVTRPEPANARSFARLAALGFTPVALPLTRTVPLEARPPSQPCSGVVVTSANALRHAPDAVLQALIDLPCHCVGETTAKAARAAGFSHVSVGPGDAAGQADTVLDGANLDAPLAYPCGKVRRPEFERRLADHGLRLLAIETYDTIQVSYSTQFLSDLLNVQGPLCVLLYSAEAALAFAANLGPLKSDQAPVFQCIICISERVREALPGRLADCSIVAAHPDEDAMFAALSRAG